MSELYRDFIDNEMNDVITALNGTITPTPVNSELYRNFLNRKADDIITALNGTITPAPIGDELYRDFIERKFDDVISGIGSYIPPIYFPSVSGAVCSFDSQYAGLPLKAHTVAVNAVQSGSGTPSPDNDRPISGWSAITITANSVPTVIQIGSKVYGGYYDARTGLFTVTHGFENYDSNNMPYMQIGTISGGVKTRVFIRQSGVSQDISGVPDMLCNIAEPVEVNAQYQGDKGISIRVNANINNQGFYIYDEDIQTLTEWQDYINNNSITVVYPVATPQTIQLPPCPIDTLLGVNNIFADTGDTTLQYIKIGGNT